MPLSSDAARAAEKHLRDEQHSVEKELEDLGATSDGGVKVLLDEGFADAAQTTSERAQVLSIVDGLRQRLEDVVAALSRIEKGTYGQCTHCGNDIPPERLEAVPTAALCIDCKQRR
ncbi:MAG: TraR/DksA family transcriptional regulator [Actinomycetota bacterium]